MEKCEKCGCDMTLTLTEKGDLYTTEIWRCKNLRCGYMMRVIKSNSHEK